MNEDKLRKIRGLLAKAESTDSPHEAESFMAHATKLIEMYGIDQAMLERDMVKQGNLKPVQKTIMVEAPYGNAKSLILTAVSNFNNCKAILLETGKRTVASVVGFESDIEMVELMFTSLLAQCSNAMLKEQPVGNTKAFRQAFVLGFANRVNSRLVEQKRETAEQMREARAEMDGLAPSTEIVLVDRTKAVTTEFKTLYPRVRSTSVSSSSRSGRASGDAAGARASLSNSTGINGSRGMLS